MDTMKYVCDVCGWEYDEAAAIRITESRRARNGKTCRRILPVLCAASEKIPSAPPEGLMTSEKGIRAQPYTLFIRPSITPGRFLANSYSVSTAFSHSS